MAHQDTLLTSSPGGITQVTMVERIAQETHQATQDDKDYIQIAIINSMDHHKHDRFWFNEATATMTLTDGVDEYGVETSAGQLDGYPSDFLRPDLLYVQVSDVWRILEQRSIDYVRNQKTSDNFTGWPRVFAWHHEKLIFVPKPNDAYSVRMEYVKDLGIPRYKSVGGEWVFTEPGSDEPWGSSFSNAWLDHAEMMIRQFAKWLLFTEVYNDPVSAQRALTNYQIAKSQIRKAHTNYHQRISRTPAY